MLARLGPYLLISRLNRGGMAEVFLAKRFGLEGAGQILVLKCILPSLSEDPAMVSMLVEEAKLSVQLSHQNIARTFELGRIGSQTFIAMEYLPGRDLRAVLDRLRTRNLAFPEDLALHVLSQVCEGLDYAHRKAGPAGEPLHIVHRDVSPQNVVVGFDGGVKLIDFGIAKATAQARQHSRVLKGKWGYMAPEQARSKSVDARTDVFAAGALLFELLTSRRLFTGRSEMAVLEKVRFAEIYPPTLAAPDISPEAEGIVLRALAPDPGERFPSASEMRDAIVALLVRRWAPSSRKLAGLMGEIFAEEVAAEQLLLSELRGIASMPEALPELDELPVPAAVIEPREVDTQIDASLASAFQPTRLQHAYERRTEWTWGALIIAGASLVALGLVLLAVFGGR